MADTSVSYQCPNCGGPLGYKPGSGDLVKCEYCESEFTSDALEQYFSAQEEAAAAALEAKEAKWNTDAAGAEWDPEEAAILKAMTCSSCGAEIICDENTMATECCYCGNPTMITNRFNGALKPDMVIPFKKTKEDAKAAFREFYKGKKLLPDNFASEARVEAIQGMYVPYWLFDSSIKAVADFKAKNINTYISGEYNVTETSYYRAVRKGRMDFKMVPVDGSKKMDDNWMESIEPFDYSELKSFTTSYLAGYLADKYDVDVEAAVPRADERVSVTACDTLLETVTGYDSVEVENSSIVKKSNDVSYAMAPVWIVTTKYQDKPYTFVMNGQTGKFVGSLPVDEGKKKKYLAGVTAGSLIFTYYLCKLFIPDLLSLFVD